MELLYFSSDNITGERYLNFLMRFISKLILDSGFFYAWFIRDITLPSTRIQVFLASAFWPDATGKTGSASIEVFHKVKLGNCFVISSSVVSNVDGCFCCGFLIQDVMIVGEALQLLVLCLQLRTQLMGEKIMRNTSYFPFIIVFYLQTVCLLDWIS